MKKLVSLLLAFMLIFGSVPVYAAEKADISVLNEVISAGETVTLKVTLPETLPRVTYLAIEVDYNQDAFNIKKAPSGWLFADSEIPGTAKGNYSATDILEGDDLAGTVLEFIFISESIAADGDYNFTVRLSGDDAYLMPLDITGGSASVKIGDDYIPVEGIYIEGEGEFGIKEGEQIQLNAVILPENATNKNVIWSSDNEEVATVDENGLVTGVSEGYATTS